MGAVVAVQQQQRGLDRLQKVARDAENEPWIEQRMPEGIEFIQVELGAFVDQVLAPWSPHLRTKHAAIGFVVSNWLHGHGCDDAVRRLLDQLKDERAANAAAYRQSLVDPQVVEQPELILGVRAPRITRVQGSARSTSIALVHRNNAELVLEGGDRVEGHAVPEIDRRIQATRRQQQQRKPAAMLLVVNRCPIAVER